MSVPTFVLSSDLILRDEPQYFRSCIVFDYRQNLFREVDLATLRLLELLDQEPLCAQCILRLVKRYDANHDLAHMLASGWLVEDTVGTCSHPLELSVHKPPNWIQAMRPEERPGVAILTAPTQATIIVTQRCNLACVHCNVSATSLKGPELIPLETWTTLLDELERLKIFKVVLSGGEPFVYQDFDRLLDHFAKKRFLKSILTNGTYLTKEHVEFLKHHSIVPTLSLDGGTAGTHDAFRRSPGAFAALLRTLGWLRDMDIPFNIVSVVNNESANQVRTIAEIAYSHFASNVYFVPLKAMGRGRTAQYWTVDMATYLRVHEEIDCIAPEFPGLGLSFDENLEEQEFGPTPAKTQFHETPFGHTTCMAGKNGFVVDDDGTVYGCMVAMQMKVGAVGSILEKSAEDIWRDSRWGIFRDPLNNGCRANMLHHSKNSGKELKLVELQRRG